MDLWGDDVKVLVVYPGVVDTPLFTQPDNDPFTAPVEFITVGELVEETFAALDRGALEVYIPAYFKDYVTGKANDVEGFVAGTAEYMRQQARRREVTRRRASARPDHRRRGRAPRSRWSRPTTATKSTSCSRTCACASPTRRSSSRTNPARPSTERSRRCWCRPVDSRRSRPWSRSPRARCARGRVNEGMRPALLFGESLAAIIGVKEDPDWQAAMQRPRHRGLRQGADRPVAGGVVRLAARGRAPHQPLHLLPPRRGDRQRVRPADRRRRRVLRHPARARCSRSSTSASCRCPTSAATTCPTRSGRCATTSSRSRSCSPTARASRSTVTTCAGRAGRSAWASIRTRGWCCTPSRTTTAIACGRCCTARRSPRWSCPTAIPGAMHGWKNAFDAGEWGLGRMANSLKLGCDCLGVIHYFDAVLATEQGAPVHRRARHLHARRGLRHPLEAPRHAGRHRRDAPVAPPGRELHRHRRQLRVRLLLVLLPRRQHPVGGEAHGHRVAHGDHPRRPAASSPT